MKSLLKWAGAVSLAAAILAGGVNVASAAPDDPSTACAVGESGQADPKRPCGVREVDPFAREGDTVSGLVEGEANATVMLAVFSYDGVLLPGAEQQVTLSDEGRAAFEVPIPKLGQGWVGGGYRVGISVNGELQPNTDEEFILLSERADYWQEPLGEGTADSPWEFSLIGAYPGHSYKMQALIGGAWTDLDTVFAEPADEYGEAYVIAATSPGTPQGEYTVRVVNQNTGAESHAMSGVVLGAPASVTAATAGVKRIGQLTNAWGIATGVPFDAEVVTQVRVGDTWSTSQRGVVDPDTESYALPLTYGRNNPGTYTYRVGVKTAARWVWSAPVTITRVSVSAATAGRKKVGRKTYVWGAVRGIPGRTRVVTQVRVRDAWSTSQRGRTDSRGKFVLPVTYGNRTPGTYTYRVGVQTSKGWVWSDSMKLVRTR